MISRHSQETRLLRCRRPSLPVYWKCVEKHLDSFALICSVYRGVSITASLMWPAARAPVCLLKPSSHRDPTQDSVLTLSHTIAVDLCTHSSLSCRDGGVSVNPPKGARIGLKQRDTSKKGLHVRGKRLQCVGKCCSTRIPKVNRLSKAITQLYNCEQTT